MAVYNVECNEVLIAEGPEKRAEKKGEGGTADETMQRTVNYRAVATGVPRIESSCNKLYITPGNIPTVYNKHECLQYNPYVCVRICVSSLRYT
jgi:hypothetical protein